MQPPPSTIMQVSSSTIAIFTALVALLTSIVTVAIGKILDLIQKRQEHRYSLQKAFFEKKLKVAEAVVINFQQTIGFLTVFSTVLMKTPQFTSMPDSNTFLQSLGQMFLSQLKKIAQETNDNYNAASLYLDMPDFSSQPTILLGKLLDLVIAANLLNEKAKALTLTPDPLREPELEKFREQGIQFLRDAKSAIESSKTEMDKFICDLRNEMKRYEPWK